MLSVENLSAGYGSAEVLHNITLHLDDGEIVTLLGRNGMGKSTIVHCLCGQLPAKSGSIEFSGRSINALSPYQIARLGLGLVPEERHIFPNLTVSENLLVAAANRSGTPTPWTLKKIFALFPRLDERARHSGNQLSGGEQQMLAIARALMTNPTLLVLDEATEGLAPLICEEIWSVVHHLKQQGQSILIIDKDLDSLLSIANRYYLIENGNMVSEGPVERLSGNAKLQKRFLGI